MNFVIKCAYCNNTYAVSISGNETSFECNCCGAANDMERVIERVPTWKGLVKGKAEPVTDTEIGTIKSFDISKYKVKSDLEIIAEEYNAASDRERKGLFEMLADVAENHWYPELKDDN